MNQQTEMVFYGILAKMFVNRTTIEPSAIGVASVSSAGSKVSVSAEETEDSLPSEVSRPTPPAPMARMPWGNLVRTGAVGQLGARGGNATGTSEKISCR